MKATAVRDSCCGPGRPAIGGSRAGRILLAVIVGSLAAAAPAVAGRGTAREALPADVAAVLERIDAAQERIHTMRAEIKETRTLSLLAKPEVLEGILSFERPEKLRWDYVRPARRSYVMADGKMTGWLPEQNRIEEIDVSSRQRRIRRLVAIGQDSDSLQQEFEISTAATSSLTGTDELILVPKSRRLRKRLAEVRLWIDGDNGMPRQLRYRTGDGDEVLLEMVSMDVNADLGPRTFVLDVPRGAKVVRGISSFGLPGFGNDDPGS